MSISAKFTALSIASLSLLVAVVLGAQNVQAMTWSGGINAYNKTTGAKLPRSGVDSFGCVGQNIVHKPEGLGPKAHHFTVILKDMSNGEMVYFQTMKSRWSIKNPTRDGSLGWTTYKAGSYWMQVDAYQANGVGAGNYYGILNVSNCAIK